METDTAKAAAKTAAKARLAAKKEKQNKKKAKLSEQDRSLLESKKITQQQNIQENFARHGRKKQIKAGTDATKVVIIDNVVPKEARDLAEEFRPSPISTKDASSFTLNSMHRFPTNAKLATYDQFFERQVMRQTILETIGGALSLGLTIELVSFITGSNNNNFIEYRIVNESSYTPPVPTEADWNDIVSYENGVLHIAPFLMPVSRLISAHPSVRKHNKRISEAVVRLLRRRGLLNEDLDTAPLVDDSTTGWGCYGACLEDRNEELFVKKTGFSKDLLRRMMTGYDINDLLVVLCDLSSIDYDTDIAIQLIVERGFEDISNDLDVSAPIKRFLDKFFSRGGNRYGGKDTLVGKIVESGLQYGNGEAVIAEGLQFDDNIYFGMQGHILKTLAILEPSLAAIAERAKSQPVLSPIEWTRMSWPVAPHPNPKRADQLVHKPLVTGYTIGIGGDGSNIESAYDEPAILGATTIEDRYSSDYGRGSAQTMKALDKISTLIKKEEAVVKLLDRNRTACNLGNTTMESLIEENSTYQLTHNIYDGQIELHIDNDPSALLIHAPLCRSGDCRDFAKLNVNGQGCMNVDTLRNVLLKCQGKPIDTRMLAVEAHMAQRLYKDGLGQDDRMKGLLVREYLAPELQPLNKYGGNRHGPIPHYPLYPMANKNKTMYTRKL